MTEEALIGTPPKARPRECNVCGKEFTPPYRAYARLYCSEECRRKRRTLMNRRYSHVKDIELPDFLERMISE